MSKTTELYEKAANIIDERGLNHGDLADGDTHGGAVCAVGAINIACHDWFFGGLQCHSPKGERPCDHAIEALALDLQLEDNPLGRDNHHTIYDWSDRYDKDYVVDYFREKAGVLERV